MLHLQISEVEDLVENLVTVFREGVTHFVEELDSKLQSEFQSLEQRETQLRVDPRWKRTSQLQVRFDELDKDQIVSPDLASDFLVNAEMAETEFFGYEGRITGSYCKRAPKPWEIVSIAGREYATLPPKCPEEQDQQLGW
eukprot:s1573_g2.t1